MRLRRGADTKVCRKRIRVHRNGSVRVCPSSAQCPGRGTKGGELHMSDHRLGRPPAHSSGHQPASGLVEAPPPVQGPPWDQEPPRPGRHATPGGPPAPGGPRRRSRAVLIGGGALVVVAGIGVGLAVTGGNHPSASLSSGGTAPTDAPTALTSA